MREEERTRIAREVHDELGQALTGLKLDLAWLSGRRPGKRPLQRKIKAMSARFDETILAVRRIATELRPGVLDNLGLAAAIEWQAAEFQERTHIRCELRIEVKGTIWDREFNTMCFRIFQETLTNIVRHAKATRVEVRLMQVDHELVSTVRDNGRGISEEEVVHARSIGLIGMRERVAQVGGRSSSSACPTAARRWRPGCRCPRRRRGAHHEDPDRGRPRRWCHRMEQILAEAFMATARQAGWVRCSVAGLPRRSPARRDEGGRSSMVERKPSKLHTWVRFPSPAPGSKVMEWIIFRFSCC